MRMFPRARTAEQAKSTSKSLVRSYLRQVIRLRFTIVQRFYACYASRFRVGAEGAQCHSTRPALRIVTKYALSVHQ